MKLFRQILSFALALLVFISSSSFSVGMHYCGGEVRNLALSVKAQGCEHQMDLPPCHRKAESNCCDDDTILHEGKGFTADITILSFNAPSQDILHNAVVMAELIPSISTNPSRCLNEHPPDRVISDIPVLIHSLLI